MSIAFTLFFVSQCLLFVSVGLLFSFFYFSFQSAKRRELRERVRRITAPVFNTKDPEQVVENSLDRIIQRLEKYASADDAMKDKRYFIKNASLGITSRLFTDEQFRDVLFAYLKKKELEGL